jgi:3-dehydroquinate synthetase
VKKQSSLKPGVIFDHMQHDKKFVAGKNRFVLAVSIGRVKVVSGVPSNIIQSAIKKIL